MRLNLLLICSLLVTVGCASPSVTQPKFEQSLNSRHWFEQLAHDAPTPLTYLSPRQPYLNHFTNIASHEAPTAMTQQTPAQQLPLPLQPVLSPGDRIRTWMPKNPLFSGVFNQNNDEFNNIFEINIDGHLKLPYLQPIYALGLTLAELEVKLNQALIEQGVFKAGVAYLNVTIVEWASVTVFVSGSVFAPGQVTINVRSAEAKQYMRDNNSGDFPHERLLPTALKSAGGVAPDANVHQIEVIRNNQVHIVDLRGILLGYPTANFPLMSGDMIRVNSIGTPQMELIRPSAITPPGVRVFISNLTRPAYDNASSAVGKESTSLPYGSRFLTAIVSGNCAGGTVSTNSDRIAVLVSKDPLTGKPIAIERNVEDLLRAPNRIDLNPFIMPEDSIVCYDSSVTNLRDVGRAISDILFPVSWITKGLTGW